MKIGICMPYYEHWECFKRVLISYRACGYYNQVTLYVCDDGSIKEPLRDGRIEALWPERYRLIQLPEKRGYENSAIPRNLTIQEAVTRGEDLIFLTQCDVFHSEDVLTGAIEKIKTYPDKDVVVKVPTRRDPLYKLSEWQSHPVYRPVIYSSNYLAWADLYEKHGLYDNEYRNLGYGAEDLDFFLHLQKQGVAIDWLEGKASTHLYHKIKYTQDKDQVKALYAYFKSKWGFTPVEYLKGLSKA